MVCKCKECGNVFDAEDQVYWEESRGECFGFNSSEKCGGGCPECGGDFEASKECDICGFEFFEDDLHGGVCTDCVDSYKKDFKICYNIAKSSEDLTAVYLNAFIATVFTTAEIEQIVLDFAEKNRLDVDCTDYIERDKHWFGEGLAEEVSKNENSEK